MKTNDRILLDFCGHTKEDHVEATNYDLKDRLINGNYDDLHYSDVRVDLATKFISEKIALACIRFIIKKNEFVINQWTNDRCDRRLILKQNFTKPVGFGFAKWTNFRNTYDMYGCIVVLELGYNGSDFNIVTAYPSPNQAITQKIKNDRVSFRKSK